MRSDVVYLGPLNVAREELMSLWLLAMLACVEPCPTGTAIRVDVRPEGRTRWCEAPDGAQQGPTAAYSAEGHLRWEGRARRGQRDGLWRWWGPSGALVEEGTYRDGVQEGAWWSFAPDGQLLRRGEFEAGEPSGLWESFTLDGAPVARSTWRDERLVYDETFYPSGVLAAAGWRLDGAREGEWRRWYTSGAEQESGTFTSGEPAGEWRTWYASGQLASDRRVAGQVTLGYERRWSPTGEPLPQVASAPSMSGGGFRSAAPVDELPGAWRFVYEGAPLGEPAWIGDDVVVAAGRMVFGLRPDDGHIAWVAEAPAELARWAPQAVGGRAAFVTTGGDAVLVDRSAWQLHDLSVDPLGPWVSDGDAVHFRAREPASGAWRYDGFTLERAPLPSDRAPRALAPTNLPAQLAGGRAVSLGAGLVAAMPRPSELFVLHQSE